MLKVHKIPWRLARMKGKGRVLAAFPWVHVVGITEVGRRSVFLSPETLRLGTECLGSSWNKGRGRVVLTYLVVYVGGTMEGDECFYMFQTLKVDLFSLFPTSPSLNECHFPLIAPSSYPKRYTTSAFPAFPSLETSPPPPPFPSPTSPPLPLSA